MPPDLTISLINHSNPDLLGACLRSLFAATRATSLEVWVVDNATGGAGVAALQAEFPQVQWLFNGRRQGFSTNHNQALRQAAGRYACILNDDTIIHDGAFDTLVAYLDAHPEVGMAGARLLNPDGSRQPCAFRAMTLLSEAAGICLLPAALCGWKGRWIDPVQEGDEPAAVDWVLGACLVVRRETMAEIGLLDDVLSPVANTEEVDWCLRARRAGWTVAFCPQAVLTHIGGQSVWRTAPGADRMRVEMHRTRIAFFRKHYGAASALLLRVIHCVTLPWNALMLTQSLLRRTVGAAQYRSALATLWQTARMSMRSRGEEQPR